MNMVVVCVFLAANSTRRQCKRFVWINTKKALIQSWSEVAPVFTPCCLASTLLHNICAKVILPSLRREVETKLDLGLSCPRKGEKR